MSTHNTNAMSLYRQDGARLYLSQSERQRFIDAALKEELRIQLFCLTLVYVGCRLSEAVNLTKQDLQINEGVISIRSLKKRDKHHVREVPVPRSYINLFDPLICQLSDHQGLWSIASITGWRWVKKVMSEANITGPKATAKGLRHTFGTHAVLHGIPLNIIQRWIGHSQISTTAIYTNVVGPEERQLAKRMW